MFSAVVEQCRTVAAQEVESLALQDQAIVALHRRDVSAVCLGYRALELAESEVQREKILGNLGAFFVAMGRHEAARDALLIQEAVATTEKSRVQARINLLSLAGRQRNGELFTQYRAQISAASLTPEVQVNYLVESARGFIELGSPDQATVLLDEAQRVAEAHDLNRAVHEAEELRSSIGQSLKCRNSSEPMRASAPAVHVEKELKRCCSRSRLSVARDDSQY